MSIGRTFRLASLLAVVACLAAAVVAIGAGGAQAGSAAGPCVVGGSPTIKGEPQAIREPLSPVLDIACGKSFIGPFQIVAYTDVKHSLCTFVLGSPFNGGECGGSIYESRLARDGVLVTTRNWESGLGRGPANTTLSGRLLPKVTRVEVRYHRPGQKSVSEVNATVGQVDGELLRTLDQTEPFGRFAVVLPGCVPPQGLRVLAFDAEGRLVGSEPGRKLRAGNPCRPEGR
jgi:hypothetical protein